MTLDRVLKVSAVGVLFAMIYFVDSLTGEAPDFTGLYLIPVVAASYWFGVWPGLAVAVLTLGSELLAAPDADRIVLLFHGLTHMATYAFAAIVTAGLASQLENVQELKRSRDYELDLARRLQQAMSRPYLLPPGSPFDLATVTEPARELGGDVILVEPSNSGMFVSLADISGKGVSAALFSALLQEGVRDALEVSDDPGAVIASINGRMHRALPSDMFVTMFACRVCRDELRYVNAGHEPAFLLRAGAERAIPLQSAEGIPVAVREALAVPVSRTPLGPGDILLCYSDGITDSPGFAHEQDAIRRFLEAHRGFSAAELVTAIVAHAVGGSGEVSDDMSVVAVRMLEGAGHPIRAEVTYSI